MERLKLWARTLKRDIMALFLAARDPRVPWLAKAVAGGVAAYALSPIDLIPDFIPVIGLLDDLLIVPFGIVLAVKLSPAEIMVELRILALYHPWPSSKAGMAAVLFMWVAGLVFVLWMTLGELTIRFGNPSSPSFSLIARRSGADSGSRRWAVDPPNRQVPFVSDEAGILNRVVEFPLVIGLFDNDRPRHHLDKCTMVFDNENGGYTFGDYALYKPIYLSHKRRINGAFHHVGSIFPSFPRRS